MMPLIVIYFLKPLKPININKEPKKNLSIIDDDTNYWYYLDGQNQTGPISLKKMFEEYQQGKVNSLTFVWNDTMKNWMRIKDIAMISDIFTN